MAGTYNENEHKILSGVYSLILATTRAILAGSRGIVAYPFTSNWGPVNVLTKGAIGLLRSNYNAEGTKLTASKIYTHASKGVPSSVISYRMATDAAKVGTATLATGWVLETLYPSDRAFVATVKAGVEEGSIKVILTEDGVELFTATASTVAALKAAIDASDYVRVKTVGESLPTAAAGVSFTGGNNGEAVTGGNYTKFLEELEADGTANAFALDGVSDESIIASVVAWLKGVRQEGFYVSFVNGGPATWDEDLSLANTKSKVFNYRAIVNVGNGCDGYTPAEMAIFVAARVAAVALNSSLTDETVPYEAVNKRYTKSVREVAKQAGTLIFVANGDTVEIDEAVNTLTSPDGHHETAEFGKIRISNTIDYVVHDLEVFGEAYKKGKSNTDTFRATYAQNVEDNYIKPLVEQEILKEGCYYKEDPEYHGDGAIYVAQIDEAYFVGDITPTDAPERIYQKLCNNF